MSLGSAWPCSPSWSQPGGGYGIIFGGSGGSGGSREKASGRRHLGEGIWEEAYEGRHLGGNIWEDSGRSFGKLWGGSGRALGRLWEELWGLWRLWKLQGGLGKSIFIKWHHSAAIRKSLFLLFLRYVFEGITHQVMGMAVFGDPGVGDGVGRPTKGHGAAT